jgi:hypothetical protein
MSKDSTAAAPVDPGTGWPLEASALEKRPTFLKIACKQGPNIPMPGHTVNNFQLTRQPYFPKETCVSLRTSRPSGFPAETISGKHNH